MNQSDYPTNRFSPMDIEDYNKRTTHVKSDTKITPKETQKT